MRPKGSERADQLLVAKNLVRSRSEGQARILAGEVFVGETRIEKPGQLLQSGAELSVRPRHRFVSRGGDKLEHALSTLQIPVAGRFAVDIGASTGGFTDCLLQHGAARVVAVDVGKGLLDPKLRSDPRVDVREGVNARSLTRAELQGPIDLVVVDASFIGIEKLLPAICVLLDEGGELLALVKPQFEAGREAVRKGRGVIRDEGVRARTIAEATAKIVEAGFELRGATDSAVHGPRGNIEHFVWARRTSARARNC